MLLVLVIFLFNRKTIDNVLDRTGLLTHLTRERPVEEPPTVVRDEESPSEPAGRPTGRPAAESDDQPTRRPEENDPVSAVDAPDAETEIVVTAEPFEAPPPPEKPLTNEKLRRSRLYFVLVDSDGLISLRPVVRPVYYMDSPLTDTLETLLKGLSSDEISDGLLSLVPAGTSIRGVTIQDGVAYIDFNESFRFNPFGGEGYVSQLKQIVYTATEFPTVKQVQILINGDKLSYLGPESPFIGDPLTRNSL